MWVAGVDFVLCPFFMTVVCDGTLSPVGWSSLLPSRGEERQAMWSDGLQRAINGSHQEQIQILK